MSNWQYQNDIVFRKVNLDHINSYILTYYKNGHNAQNKFSHKLAITTKEWIDVLTETNNNIAYPDEVTFIIRDPLQRFLAGLKTTIMGVNGFEDVNWHADKNYHTRMHIAKYMEWDKLITMLHDKDWWMLELKKFDWEKLQNDSHTANYLDTYEHIRSFHPGEGNKNAINVNIVDVSRMTEHYAKQDLYCPIHHPAMVSPLVDIMLLDLFNGPLTSMRQIIQQHLTQEYETYIKLKRECNLEAKPYEYRERLGFR